MRSPLLLNRIPVTTYALCLLDVPTQGRDGKTAGWWGGARGRSCRGGRDLVTGARRRRILFTTPYLNCMNFIVLGVPGRGNGIRLHLAALFFFLAPSCFTPESSCFVNSLVFFLLCMYVCLCAPR